MNHDTARRLAQGERRTSLDLDRSSLEKDGEEIQSSADPSLVGGLESLHHDEKSTPSIRTSTRPQSIRPQPVKVPRTKRRGLFGRFTILAEIEEPKDYNNKTKWFITFIVSLAALAAPLGSTIIFPALSDIIESFHTTAKIANLSVALYMLGMAIFPLWWSSFSETFGRRTIYLVSFSLFVLFTVLIAVSTNITMLIILRMLGGGASASVQAVGAGTIADIWEVRERGRAMGYFYLGPLMGPLLGPIIGGSLAQGLGWRSTQSFLVIYGAILVLLLFFALPETRKDSNNGGKSVQSMVLPTTTAQSDLNRVSSRQSLQRTTKTWVKLARKFLIDPLRIVSYLRFPAVVITIYYASITFSSLYLLNLSVEVTFSKAPYNFSTIIVGLSYIPGSLGYILASVFGGRWTDTIMAREAKKAGRYDLNGKPVYRPEDRMRENAWIAAFLYPAALIWYGWTAEKTVFWAVPLLANFFFGIGSMLIFGMVTTMLTEFMPANASAGVALNNCVRNVFSCVGAIVAEPLISAIGNGWLFTGVGVPAIASSSVIWAMRRFGPGWRVEMDRKLNKER
ncbi:hypothetical protein MMC07_007127 [Pseudocyphellaria aurata]|nr:hypothetical protein [Pseudocyphellaria aurata]